MASKTEPKPLKILSDNSTLFNSEFEYRIPLYQRAFSWGEKQITQLVEDIADIPDNTEYYIGSLIVYEHENYYEVVDGQQRLTCLFLLLNCLGYEVKNSLTFACREKSDYILKNIEAYIWNRNNIEMELVDKGIARGIDIINQIIKKKEFDVNEFKEKLKKVTIYRIALPENTNLNRYFEIMNTRGEQLEQQDILKAELMKPLSGEDHIVFSRIWDACSDMYGYVQMHFDTKARSLIFGTDWTIKPSNEWADYISIVDSTAKADGSMFIKDIIEHSFENDDYEETEDEKRVRFESIIDFPYFLQHVLRIYISSYQIKSKDESISLFDELMDDKKLCESFDRVLANGVDKSNKPLNECKEIFSKQFILCLLRTRYFFDKNIIKREYTPDDNQGRWGLWSLKAVPKKLYSQSKVPSYTESLFIKKGQFDSTNQLNNKTNVMLQAALRVSYTSQKSMHWITKLLLESLKDDCDMSEFGSFTEDLLKTAVVNDFFEKCRVESYDANLYSRCEITNTDGFFRDCQSGPYASFAMGLDTPNIVFNYLDFLIWEKDPNKYKDFAFEFRSSVEHWYPRNPSSDNIDKWEGGGVDQFGNLCLVSSSVNSRFSNNSPSAKSDNFKNTINKNSLKLQEMSRLTKETNNDYEWRESVYKVHEIEMLKMLMEACDIKLLPVFCKDSEH